MLPLYGALCFAQESSQDAPQLPLHTLHAYTTLAQVPVLALRLDQAPLFGKLDLTRFRISLDSGTPFAPSYVRQEGDDPLALAVLIDGTQASGNFLPHLPAAVAALAKGALTAQDRVTIYSNDCSLMRTGYALSPAYDKLEKSVASAVEPWVYRDKHLGSGRCQPTINFSQAIDIAIAGLAAQPGRRALLVVAESSTANTMENFKLVVTHAQRSSVAVFGILLGASDGSSVRTRPVYRLDLNPSAQIEDRFRRLCELSGGLRLHAEPRDLKSSLQDLVKTLRGRYILEFPRGRQDQAGTHSLTITYVHDSLYLAPTGITMSSATDQELHGVETPHADTTRTLQEPGSRRVLIPQAAPK